MSQGLTFVGVGVRAGRALPRGQDASPVCAVVAEGSRSSLLYEGICLSQEVSFPFL